MSVPVAVAVDLVLEMLQAAAQASVIVRQAQAAGQEKLTPEQWLQITGLDDAGRARLVAAIQGEPSTTS